MTRKYTIATLGSHSALQVLKGAKDEGFKTLAICLKGREKPYQLFKVTDEIIVINSYQEFLTLEKKLTSQKIILIPHASLITYLGYEKVEKLKMKYFGNEKILRWEADRKLEGKWLKKAKLKLPIIFNKTEEIDRPVIVKFHGAQGGRGYFLAKSKTDFEKKIRPHKGKQYVIQEYIIGVPIYVHYFYSFLNKELEIMGFDKRYESNVDSLGRISARDQMVLPSCDPSYVICGNIPIVIRESFLPRIITMGEAVVKVSKKITPPGLFGPFCLEMVITPREEIFVFEISARIVAGTNPYINGSPYTQLVYKEPMSTGRRIAREIKIAIKTNKLDKVLQ